MLRGNRQVVVTGFGTINPLGRNTSEFWKACVHGTSGVERIEEFAIPKNFSGIAGTVKTDSQELAAQLDAVGHDRCVLLALAAAEEAVSMASIAPGEANERMGVYVSTAISQIASMEAAFIAQTSPKAPLPTWAQTMVEEKLWTYFDFSSLPGILAARHGARAGHITVSTGCTGGLDAIGYAFDAIRSGDVDMALTGASEAPITPLVVAAFGKIGAMSCRNDNPSGASRPFDRDRDGFVLGRAPECLCWRPSRVPTAAAHPFWRMYPATAQSTIVFI